MANIMVVDDAAFMRHIIRSILEEAGHSVICEAENGREAVDKYRKYRPDLVTMDVTMPEMEGVDALREIRASIHMRSSLCAPPWGEADHYRSDQGRGEGFHRQAAAELTGARSGQQSARHEEEYRGEMMFAEAGWNAAKSGLVNETADR